MTGIIHLSDLHFGDADPRLVERAVEAIHGLAPDALAVTGDLTQKGRRGEFDEARVFLDRFATPQIIAPGNHDTPYAHLFTRAVAPFSRFERRVANGSGRLMALGGVWARVLNTARGVQARFDWSLGAARPRDVTAVAEELDAAPQGVCRIVACHHPLETPRNAPFPARTLGGVMAARRFADAKVDLILSGHLHVAFAEPLPYADHRTYAIGAATAFSPRTRGEPAGFNHIVVADHSIAVTPHAWDGSDFVARAPQELERRVTAAD